MGKVRKGNNKFKFAFRVFSITIFTGLIYYNFLSSQKHVFANTIDTKIDLNNDGNPEIVKFESGALNISSISGRVIFKKDEDKNVYRNVAFIVDKTNKDTELLIQNKTKDTSGLLSYSIYKMDGSQMIEVVHKEDLYKGVIKIQSSSNFVEEVPVYSNGNSNAVPTYTVKNYFTLEDNKLVLTKTEKLSYNPSSALKTSVYYKNPTYAEIEKILTNVAYEKGIPAEIFKAIAWQETKGTDKDNGNITNWRQFSNGQPLIGYDHIGIGLMQVSSYDPTDTAYVNRLKYDVEFNVREGAEILLTKWALQNSTPTYKIPKVGDASPNYLAHWYYAMWAYNGYSNINNPATNHANAYQTLVIGHVNNVFKKPMIDLYEYNPSLFTAGVCPRIDVPEVNGKHAGDFKIKDQNYKYITTSSLTIRDSNLNIIGSFAKNDIVTIKSAPVIKDAYVRYLAYGNGKSGYVIGNWLEPVGDTNGDNVVDMYDMVKQSKSISGQGTVVNDTNRTSIEKADVNMDGVVDIKDIA
ncbi:MAG TPA: hypothetical protein VIM42_10025, partial [Clostridium sp.]